MRSGFSKTPETHSQDLENSHHAQLFCLQLLRMDFHFSGLPTGTTVFFFYPTTLFPLPRRVPQISIHAPAQTGRKVRQPGFAARNARFRAWNPELRPLFHAHRQAEREYNQN
jgi:hypothetical protein